MKQIKTILVCGAVLALTGLTSLLVAAGTGSAAKAIVRSFHGSVQYKVGDAAFQSVKVNMELPQGAILKSGPSADAYLQVNGTASTVKLSENTTVALAKMLKLSPEDTSTELKLDGGTVLGSVRKLAANSDYKVTVPNGVAGIRGTDFQVTVTFQANGSFTVMFQSVTGTIICTVSPPLGGAAGPETRTLTSGQQWQVSGQQTTTTLGGVTYQTTTITVPASIPPAVLNAINVAIATLPTVIAPPTVTTPGTTTPPPTVPPTTPPNTNPSNTGGTDTGTQTSGM